MRDVKRCGAMKPEGVALADVLAAPAVLLPLLNRVQTLFCPFHRRIGFALGVAQYGHVDATDGTAAVHHFVDTAEMVSDELVDAGVLGAEDRHAKLRTSEITLSTVAARRSDVWCSLTW